MQKIIELKNLKKRIQSEEMAGRLEMDDVDRLAYLKEELHNILLAG